MKTVLINRAVPGSGKTTFAKNIFAAVSSAGSSIAVHSTGEYFMHDGRYMFDASILGECQTSDPVKPFDYDVLIQITPETYHELKDKIGMQILCLLTADRVAERT